MTFAVDWVLKANYLSIYLQAIEMRERILPLMGLVRRGQIEGLGKDYVLMKYHIIIK